MKNTLEPFAKKIITSYQRGQSMAALAQKYKAAVPSVYELLKRHGIETRNPNGAIRQQLFAHADVIVKLYREGVSGWKIAEQFGVSFPTIYKLLRERGETIRHDDQDATKILLENEQRIIELYKSGKSTRQISQTIGVHYSPICNLLERNKVPRRVRQQFRRGHTLNESCFDEITEASAYWIGFLFADGHVGTVEGYKMSPRIALELKNADIEHVEAFKKFLGASHKTLVRKREYGMVASITVSSKKIAQRLAEFGLLGGDKRNQTIKQLENNRHFWRGVVDGDGSLGFDGDNFRINLCGHRPLLTQFQTYARAHVPAKGKKPLANLQRDGSIWKIALGNSRAEHLSRLLYSDCSLALPRKLRIAERIIAPMESL